MRILVRVHQFGSNKGGNSLEPIRFYLDKISLPSSRVQTLFLSFFNFEKKKTRFSNECRSVFWSVSEICRGEKVDGLLDRSLLNVT